MHITSPHLAPHVLIRSTLHPQLSSIYTEAAQQKHLNLLK